MGLGILASLGIDFVKDMIADKGEELVTQGIKKATGIDVSKKETFTKEELELIKNSKQSIKKELELLYADKQSARDMAVELGKSDSWLLKNTGSLIGLATIVICFTLFGLLLNGNLSIENSNVAMIVGFAGGYITQILSFYFGSSKNKQ